MWTLTVLILLALGIGLVVMLASLVIGLVLGLIKLAFHLLGAVLSLGFWLVGACLALVFGLLMLPLLPLLIIGGFVWLVARIFRPAPVYRPVSG